jgi:hypothetical protein
MSVGGEFRFRAGSYLPASCHSFWRRVTVGPSLTVALWEGEEGQCRWERDSH